MNYRSKCEIDRIVNALLKDTGQKEPPFHIEPFLEYLNLYREYYNLEDPNLFQEIKHKLQIGKQKILSITKKIKLLGVWFPDTKKILIDNSIHPIKQKWASFHDLGHSTIPWHREYFLGDTAQTLDPGFQDLLEAEANYAGSGLMFGGDYFTREALDTVPEWDSIELLHERYETSYPTTLYRYIQCSHDLPMAMISSTPYWKEIPEDQETRFRRFVGSEQFKLKFSTFDPSSLLPKIEAYSKQQIFGIVGEFETSIKDINGDLHRFKAENFFNRYNLSTFLVYLEKESETSIILPNSF